MANTPDDIVPFNPDLPYGTIVSNGPAAFVQYGRRYTADYLPLDAHDNLLEVPKAAKTPTPSPKAEPQAQTAPESVAEAPYDLTQVDLPGTNVQALRMLWRAFFPDDEFPGKASAVVELHKKQEAQLAAKRAAEDAA